MGILSADAGGVWAAFDLGGMSGGIMRWSAGSLVTGRTRRPMRAMMCGDWKYSNPFLWYALASLAPTA